MKMSAEHYSYIENKIVNAFTVQTVKYYMEHLKDDPRVKNLHKRVRWDLLYKAVSSQWVCDNLYQYMNDTHIDTALKKIMETNFNLENQ